MRQYTSTTVGFSLVEALVAISLLLIVVVGPMQILHQSSNSTKYASEQMTAYFLAQEGLELVHKERDDLLLQYFDNLFGGGGGITNPMASMSAGVLNDCFNVGGCGLHVQNDGSLVAQACTTAGGPCRLYINSSPERARYTHTASGNSPTPYVRRITIERIPTVGDIKEFKVTSRVQWRTGFLLGGQEVELTTFLVNVYDTD